MAIRVIAFDAHNQEVASCPLTSSSAYRLGGLTPGIYWLQAEVIYGQTKYACNSVPTEVTLAADAIDPIERDLQLSAPLVQGRVLQPDKTSSFIPAKNSEVMVCCGPPAVMSWIGQWLTVRADIPGRRPAGTYYLQAMAQVRPTVMRIPT
jgi:hypothetical protein